MGQGCQGVQRTATGDLQWSNPTSDWRGTCKWCHATFAILWHTNAKLSKAVCSEAKFSSQMSAVQKAPVGCHQYPGPGIGSIGVHGGRTYTVRRGGLEVSSEGRGGSCETGESRPGDATQPNGTAQGDVREDCQEYTGPHCVVRSWGGVCVKRHATGATPSSPTSTPQASPRCCGSHTMPWGQITKGGALSRPMPAQEGSR